VIKKASVSKLKFFEVSLLQVNNIFGTR
jgi:hypothetical protein